MKFPHLPVGQRFNFKGKAYTKTGPLTASEEGTGKSRLIMKSAEVTPLDLPDTPVEQRERQFSETEVRELLASYREKLRKSLIEKLNRQEGASLEQLLEMIDEQRLPID